MTFCAYINFRQERCFRGPLLWLLVAVYHHYLPMDVFDYLRVEVGLFRVAIFHFAEDKSKKLHFQLALGKHSWNRPAKHRV